MKSNIFWLKFTSKIAVLILASVLVACSDTSNNLSGFEGSQPGANSQSLRNYEITAQTGSFRTIGEEGGETQFELMLSGLGDVLFFTNEGELEAGSETLYDLISNIWPVVYGTHGPNAVLRYSADEVVHDVLCVLNKPRYDESTGLLHFTITYQEGTRPVDQGNLRDVKIIITSNAEEVHPAQWSTILNGNTATLGAGDAPDEYLLTIAGVNENIFATAAAPHRNSVPMTAHGLMRSWEAGYDASPVNASLSYSAPMNAETGVQMLTLLNPVYDGDRNVLEFTAKPRFGTSSLESGLSVNHPTLYIKGAVGNAFSTTAENHFSIQYRNSTLEPVIVWLNGAQPPCSKAEAMTCAVSGKPDLYTTDWKNLAKAFAASGTYFFIHNVKTKITRKIDVTNRILLESGETLRIVPPLDENNRPQWYYNNGVKVTTAGVTGWVTRKDVNMPAPTQVNVFEYNLDYPNLKLWADISAVDGLNSNATMAWVGPGCGGPDCGTGLTMPRRLMTNLEPHNGKNDGCPHVMVVDGARTCPNPKHYPERITARDRPAWVVGSKSFSTERVSTEHSAIWKSAGSPDGLQMCAAASGLPLPKEAYHIWWATNGVGKGWLNYLQRNKKGRCDAYGWAYDEKKWKPGDKFDKDGNPPDNTTVTPQFSGLMKDDTYLNIDILKVM